MLKRVTRKIGDVRMQHVAVRKRWFWASTIVIFSLVVAGWALTMRFTLEELSRAPQAAQSSNEANLAEFWSSLKGNFKMLSDKVGGGVSLMSQVIKAGSALEESPAAELSPSPAPSSGTAQEQQAWPAEPDQAHTIPADSEPLAQ